MAVPSFAQSDDNITVISPGQINFTYIPISGQISFDPSNYDNITSVTQLTIYAENANGGNHTNPAADGTFSMMVPGNGTCSIYVYPSTLHYLNSTTNATYSMIYPDRSNPLILNVPDSGVTGINITSQVVQTGIAMSVTPEPPAAITPTPTPSPGFTGIAALLIIGLIAVVAYKRK